MGNIHSWPFRCDTCGRFVSLADLISGRAWHRNITPSSAVSEETDETMCPACAAGPQHVSRDFCEVCNGDCAGAEPRPYNCPYDDGEKREKSK